MYSKTTKISTENCIIHQLIGSISYFSHLDFQSKISRKFVFYFISFQQNKEESEDDEYALSENWTFQQTNRRWSRVGEMDMEKPLEKLAKALNTSRESSPEQNDEKMAFSTLGVSIDQTEQNDLPVRLRRTGSERLKDGAKALLRRVESIKTRRRKRQNRDGIVINSPNALDLSQIGSKVNPDLKCIITTYSTPPSPVPNNTYTTNFNKFGITGPNNELKVHITTDYGTLPDKLNPHLLSPRHYTTLPINHYHSTNRATSPTHFFPNNASLVKDLKGSGDDSSPYCSDASQESSGNGGIIISTIPKKRPSRTRRFLQKGSKIEDVGALSDSECQQMFSRNRKVFQGETHLTPHAHSIDAESKASKFSRGGSLNLGKESQKFKESFKSRSFRSRSSARVKPDGEFDYKIRTR